MFSATVIQFHAGTAIAAEQGIEEQVWEACVIKGLKLMAAGRDDAADSRPCNKSFTGKEDTPLTELIMKDLASDSFPETPATGILQVSLTGCFGKNAGGESRDRR